MAESFESALESLYRAPLADFVAERKRLAAELKASGDKATSTRVTALGRPSVSAWAVNQLWWQRRESFTALLEAAARVRRGERDASKAHKEALATLREHATQLLSSAGNAATESTLRRVTTTLSALAVTGGFEPDPTGALVADRDPPGFEALEQLGSSTASSESSTASSGPTADDLARQRAEEVERLRAEQAERSRRLAERERLSTTLREAELLRETQQRELARLRAELETAERGLKETQALLADIEARLASL